VNNTNKFITHFWWWWKVKKVHIRPVILSATGLVPCTLIQQLKNKTPNQRYTKSCHFRHMPYN